VPGGLSAAVTASPPVNVANLLNPGGSLNLLTILNELGL
jgi:hypothetical protein